MTFEGVEYQKGESWACGGRVAHFSCNMTVARLPTGTLAEQTLGPPEAMACFSTGNGGGQDLVALPDCGQLSHGQRRRPGSGRPTGRWCAFPRAPWPSILLRQGYGGQGRSALPRRGHVSPWATTCFSTGNDGGEGACRPTGRWPAFPWAPWPSRRSALPRRGHGSLLALRRQRRGSPPYRIAVCLSTGVAAIQDTKEKASDCRMPAMICKYSFLAYI